MQCAIQREMYIGTRLSDFGSPPPRQRQEIQPQAEGKELADLLAAIVAELIAAMEEMGVVLVLG